MPFMEMTPDERRTDQFIRELTGYVAARMAASTFGHLKARDSTLRTAAHLTEWIVGDESPPPDSPSYTPASLARGWQDASEWCVTSTLQELLGPVRDSHAYAVGELDEVVEKQVIGKHVDELQQEFQVEKDYAYQAYRTTGEILVGFVNEPGTLSPGTEPFPIVIDDDLFRLQVEPQVSLNVRRC